LVRPYQQAAAHTDVPVPHPVDQELVDAAESVAVAEFNERFDTRPSARAGQGGQGGAGELSVVEGETLFEDQT
jgi:hypothetical protein